MVSVAAEVVHRALDGSRFALRGDLALDGGATSTVDVITAQGMHQLHSGPVGLGPDMIGGIGPGGFSEEFAHQGATVRVGHWQVEHPHAPSQDDLWMATWTGRRYSLVAHMYNASTQRLLALLQALRIEEQERGITAVPASDGTRFRGPAAVIKPVQGLGLLEIRTMTRQLVRELPSWAGAVTGPGELFRDTLSNGQPYFLLVTPDVRMTVLPLDGTVIERIPDLLGALRVDRLG